MPMQEDVKTDIIRHLQYEVTGLYQNNVSGGSLAYGGAGWRFFGSYGALLRRMNMLRPVEEAKITGLATGAIFFTGPGCNPGDQITITLNAASLVSPIDAVVTVPGPIPGQPHWTLLTLAGAIAQAFAMQPAFQAAGFYAIADYGAQPYGDIKSPAAICSINAPPGIGTFTLTPTFTGGTAPQVTLVNRPVSPYISFNSGGTVVCLNGYIPIMNFLESAFGGATTNLGIMVANGVTMRHDELDQRERQLETYRKWLSKYMGIPIHPSAEQCMRISF